MKNQKIAAITYGSVFSVIYLLITILAMTIPMIEGIILVIMPIFATYYAIKFSYKEIILFNICSLLICFLLSISDPFFTLLYIFPTLIIGDVFGITIKFKIKPFSSFIILTLSYFLMNILSLYFTKIIYNIDLLAYLLNNDQNLIQYFSLGLLFIISLVESILCISIVYNELKKLNIQIIMENLNTWYFEFLFIFCFILCLVFKFINFNIHFILFLLCLVILIPSFINFLKIYKHKNLFFIILGIFYIFSLVPINLYLNSTFIPILLLFPFFILEFAILCQKMYNQAKEKKK